VGDPIRAVKLTGGFPSVFVVLSLLALLIVPIFVQGRVEELQEDVEVAAEPARALLAEVQYLLARQTSELRGYILTGDPRYIDDYLRFTSRERQIYPELEAHASRLSPEIVAYVVELRTLSDQWHERLAVRGAGTGDFAEVRLDPGLVQDLHLRILEAAGRAELAMRGAVFDRRQEIRDVERIAQIVYFLLIAVAFGATIAVASLNARIRGLAAEATHRRQEVEHALDETARAVAARTDLIRGFTHDVKNPLGAADGYAQLLESGVRGPLTAEQLSTVESIRRSIRGGIEIIEQLLDLSRLESGGLTIGRERVEMQDLLGGLVRRYAGTAASSGLDLILTEPPAGYAAELYSDPDRIRQVLDNLISNALKYTPGGGRVLVGLVPQTLHPPPREGSWLVVGVADNGPGIPAEEVERIFDEFHRVPGTTARGHGLGLAISRRVARLLGGDVTVRSVLGEGSTFLLWLPTREEG
jgi:signal transduction histidine kinase